VTVKQDPPVPPSVSTAGQGQTVSDSSGSLPATGSSQSVLLIVGLAMVLFGLLFVALTRRPDEVEQV
jgi:LPXTG-motif cell wall-anchored protein